MILKGLEVGPFLSNCYVVGSEETKEGIIIDPGADARLILKTAQELGLAIRLIVATHAHIDHVAALAEVKAATKADYAIHQAEAAKRVATMFNRMLSPLFSGSLRSPPKPERLLQEGEVIEVGELRFEVLHTPGHSPGGICLIGHGVVFCGDTLFNLGVGRTDFPGGNWTQLMDSIHNKLMSLPDETRVFPGHGPETTIGVERQWNPFLNVEV